jgi:hypothetical protein
MPRFKTQDLLLTLDLVPKPPAAEGCLGRTLVQLGTAQPVTDWCRPCTYWGATYRLTPFLDVCPHPSVQRPPITEVEPWVVESVDDIAAIRAQIRELDAELSQLEETGLPPAFRSLEEAERAERGVKEVLERIQLEKQRLG